MSKVINPLNPLDTLLDKEGKPVVLEDLYIDELLRSSMYNFICVYRKQGEVRYFGFIDKAGELIIPCQYEDISKESKELIGVKSNSKWGFIDHTGRNCIPFMYEKVEYFSEGLVAVRLRNKWGYIDRTGKVTVPFEFNEAGPFIAGQARVRLNEKSAYIYIDKTGKASGEPHIYHEGLAPVLSENKYGFVNKTGESVIPPEYEEVGKFSQGLANVRLEGKWGFIDKNGNTVVPFIYQNAKPYKSGIAEVVSNEHCGYIDLNGTELWENE